MNINPNLLYTTYKLTGILYAANGSEQKSQGTGFGMVVEDLFLIGTVRHVVDPAFDAASTKFLGHKLTELEVRGKNLDAAGQPTVDTVTTSDAFRIFWPADNITDLAVLAQFRSKEGKKFGFPTFVKEFFPSAALMADISPGEPVAAIGYVDQHDDLDLRPLLRSGRISSDPRYPFSIPMANGNREHRGPIVAYDCFSWEGLSGGPVFAVQMGSKTVNDGLFRPTFLAGVNAGHFRHSSRAHSGLSYFYRIEPMLGLINDVFETGGRPIPFPWVTQKVPAQQTLVGWDE